MAGMLAGCSPEPPGPERAVGAWRIEYDLGEAKLPYQAQIMEDEAGNLTFYAQNGEERIRAEKLSISGDSIRVQMPIFNTELKGVFKSDSLFEGLFHDYSRKGMYSIPFQAFKRRNPPIRSQTGI